jgi:pimeloyl-ACP methyl ester carboxylesterase
VFLHGVGNTGVMWRDHMAELAEYHCLAPDLPGHGRSRRIPWVSREDTAARIARFVEALPDHRAHVVGLSLGGSVAFELLNTRPELLDHVVIDGCGAMPSRLAGPAKVGVAAVSPLIRRRAFGRLLTKFVGITEPDAIEDFIDQLRQADPRSFRRAFADAQDVRISAALLSASSPTLLVSGANELAAVHATGRLLAERMPRAEARVVPGSGHGWLGAHPRTHVAMVRAWITDTALPAELVPLPPQDARRASPSTTTSTAHRRSP